MTVTENPTRTLNAASAATSRTCTPTLRVPRRPRVRIALSERAARRHLEQFEGERQGR